MELQLTTATNAPAPAAYPRSTAGLPVAEHSSGSYVSRFAHTEEDLVAIQRLRFEVFNVELHEGLDESFATGLDRDPFDATCHHLMVLEQASGAVVGTYRVQTRAMAEATPAESMV